MAPNYVKQIGQSDEHKIADPTFYIGLNMHLKDDYFVLNWKEK